MRDTGKHNKYKTKLCQKYWIAGYCAYGPRCNFVHNEEGGRGSGGDTSGESLEWGIASSVSPPAPPIPPLSGLTKPNFGSGRLAAFKHNNNLTWVDTWTRTIV